MFRVQVGIPLGRRRCCRIGPLTLTYFSPTGISHFNKSYLALFVISQQLVKHPFYSSPVTQVLRGAQLIAVASADGATTTVEGSALPPDIQVQYVQLAPVADHTAAVQVNKHTITNISGFSYLA